MSDFHKERGFLLNITHTTHEISLIRAQSDAFPLNTCIYLLSAPFNHVIFNQWPLSLSHPITVLCTIHCDALIKLKLYLGKLYECLNLRLNTHSQKSWSCNQRHVKEAFLASTHTHTDPSLWPQTHTHTERERLPCTHLF